MVGKYPDVVLQRQRLLVAQHPMAERQRRWVTPPLSQVLLVVVVGHSR